MKHLTLHLAQMLAVLPLGGLDLQKCVPVLLLNTLEAFLQVHDLLHVVVLGHGVVLL